MTEQMQELSTAVARILADADADIAARRPVCRGSGRCCRFEEWGHRLYVTGAEVLHFAAVHVTAGVEAGIKTTEDTEGTEDDGRRHRVSLPQFFAREKVEGCPYQLGNMCTAREARPLGCRVYFCDSSSLSWQNDVYEKYHAQLKAVHERFGLPYRYVEWREALKGIGGDADGQIRGGDTD